MLNHAKLSEALRKRFGGNPRAVLRRLGLDENGGELKEAGERGGISGAHAAEIMSSLQGKISAEEMSELNLLLDRLLGEAKVEANANDDEPADRVEKFRDFLKSKGMSSAFIDKACDLIPKAGRAADRRMGHDGVNMTSFDKEFGIVDYGVMCGSPAADLAYDRGPPAFIADADMDDFNRRFPESARLAG